MGSETTFKYENGEVFKSIKCFTLPAVITTKHAMFDSSKDEWSPVSDDMDMVYDNRGFTTHNVELEPVAQEIDEPVDINQLNINELKDQLVSYQLIETLKT